MDLSVEEGTCIVLVVKINKKVNIDFLGVILYGSCNLRSVSGGINYVQTWIVMMV